MSHSLVEYDHAVKEAKAGRGRSVSDEELYDHMLKNYPEFSRLPSLQDVIKQAIGGGYAVRHDSGRLFLLPDHTKGVSI